MKSLTRRAFGKTLLTACAVPLVGNSPVRLQSEEQPSSPYQLPERIAGYVPTAEERHLAAKFLESHEKNIATLRVQDLPNGLAPSLMFSSPIIKGENGEERK